jgi:hypothetical protein
VVAAKAELAVLEVAQNHFEESSVSLYLQSLVSKRLPESLDALTEADLDALNSHLDFQLIERLHSVPAGERENREREGERENIEMVKERITFSLSLLAFYRSLILEQARESVHSAASAFKQVLDALTVTDEHSVSKCRMSFDQSAFSFSGFETQRVWMRDTVDFLALFAAESESLSLPLDETEIQVVARLNASMDALSQSFFSLSSPGALTVSVSFTSMPALVERERLAALSFFLRLSLPWICLSLQTLMTRYARIDSDDADKAKKRVLVLEALNGSSLSLIADQTKETEIEKESKFHVFWQFIGKWITLLRKLKAGLREDLARLSTGGSGNQWWMMHLQSLALTESEALSISLSLSSPAVAIDPSVSGMPYVEFAETVAEKVLTSYRHTVNNFLSLINSREASIASAHKRVVPNM